MNSLPGSTLMQSDAAQRDGAMLGQVKYERRAADFYATPPEYVDCLLHFLCVADMTVWEPACGEGHIVKRLAEMPAYASPLSVFATDLHYRGFGLGGVDFLQSTKLPMVMTMDGVRSAIITNPPFGDLAEQFVRHALELTKPVSGVVAMFMRNEWDCSAEDRPDLFEGHPAYAMKVVVTKRPRWIEGSTGSPRHNYAWYVWDWSRDDRFREAREAMGLSERQHPAIRYIHPKDARPITRPVIN